MLATTPQATTTTSTYDETRPGYANGGKLTTVTDAAGTIRYDYDANGRPVKTSWQVDGTTSALTATLDIGGYIRGKTYPDGDQIGTPGQPWTYDIYGSLKTIPGLVTNIDYNARRQTTAITYANGVSTSFACGRTEQPPQLPRFPGSLAISRSQNWYRARSGKSVYRSLNSL
nr:hypothetical protein [Chelatococcus asaccharovorans]